MKHAVSFLSGLVPAIAAALVAGVLLGGCATARSPADPLEPMNRTFYRVHEVADDVVLKPAVKVYTSLLPSFVRTGIGNFFNNIDDLFSSVNGFLQGKPQKGADDFARVFLNTSFGLGGLLDVASEAGLERGNEDFGQTLAVWGVDFGPYLFIPLLGPSSFRDGVGTGARIYLSPTGDIDHVATRNVVTGLGVIDARYQLGDAMSVVETAALDKYTFIRNAYFQRRRYLIYDGKVPQDSEDDK